MLKSLSRRQRHTSPGGLRFVAVSGTTSVTENFYVYEYGDEMLVVDCGIGFSENEAYGADLMLPDFSYVATLKKRLRGILLTHGHEDHIGAVPYLLKELKSKPDVYASPLTIGFVREKFKEHGLDSGVLKAFNPDNASLTLGSFKITPFRVTHSVPDSVGYFIETPEGNLVHVSDFKFDWTPVDGKTFDTKKLSALSSRGVLAMTSDCLGSTSPGYTQSEQSVKARINSIFDGSHGRIFFTTISSNISRMQQAIEVAERHGRKVVFVGRSIENKTEIARSLNQLVVKKSQVISQNQARNYRDSELCYIISGSYGQARSSLFRVVNGEHSTLSFKQSDTVIFSADPAPPGSKEKVDALIDKLFQAGVGVYYYDIQEDLHVSGHGSQEDIKMLLGLVKPRWAIPIGGTIRHMKAYEDLVTKHGQIGKKRVLRLLPGMAAELSTQRAVRRQVYRPKSALLSGDGETVISGETIERRKQLSASGVLAISAGLGGGRLVNIGFAQSGLSGPLEERRSSALRKKLGEIEAGGLTRSELTKKMVQTAKKHFSTKNGNSPVILVVVR